MKMELTECLPAGGQGMNVSSCLNLTLDIFLDEKVKGSIRTDDLRKPTVIVNHLLIEQGVG